MGIIGDFFRKQVKNERKELAKKYHGEYTREELTKKAAESVLRKNIKRGAIALSCAAIGISGINIISDCATKVAGGVVASTISDMVKTDNEMQMEETQNISSKIDEIASKEDALAFIKEMYVEEYNKANKTDLSVNDIAFMSSNQDYVYNIDDTYLTHGATPDDVKKSLEKNSQEYEVVDNVKVYTSYAVQDGKKVPLESFTVDKSDVVKVILGEEYLSGKDINSQDKNVLADMSSTIVEGIDLAIALNNGNNKDDITVRKYNLEKSVEKYQKQNEKTVVENEIGGR